MGGRGPLDDTSKYACSTIATSSRLNMVSIQRNSVKMQVIEYLHIQIEGWGRASSRTLKDTVEYACSTNASSERLEMVTNRFRVRKKQ